ncbi:MAG: dihydrofolate reductase family protein [Candidatus Kerfeldbacteria bacterium]|nr:dihydrofolate reductase family protein [Candidatus Kerfeldbacteria bacterium]
MDPLKTLVDNQTRADPAWLPEELRRLYDGDLVFTRRTDRPTVVANFVSSLDGVVSLNIPGRSGGGEISGHDSGDRLIMGLLRTVADAVVVGAGTLHGDPGHVRISRYIAPELETLLSRWRQDRGLPSLPLNVIVSASGRVDLNEPTFHTPDLPTVIMTTLTGQQRLIRDHGQGVSATQVRVAGDEALLQPHDILNALHSEFGVQLLLHEGGPTLFGQFLKERLIDELFLTIAPQIVGRSRDTRRLGLVEGAALAPETNSWWGVLSEKAAGSYRYFRLVTP